MQLRLCITLMSIQSNVKEGLRIMEFMNRSGQNRPSNNGVPSAPAPKFSSRGSQDDDSLGDVTRKAEVVTHSGWFRWTFVILLFSATALFIALLFMIVFGSRLGPRESNGVRTGQYQAVFVNVNGTNGGQVYFGKIRDLTPQYIRLTNVFYIQNQQQGQDQASAYNLVKLGCELHGPEDEMYINRSEVFFWENLKDSSQVAQKAAEFYKQNPSGSQKCSDSNSTSTQQSSGSTEEAPANGNGNPTGPGTTTTPPATPPATTKKP